MKRGDRVAPGEARLLIENRVLRLPPEPGDTWLERVAEGLRRLLPAAAYPLRFAIVEASEAGCVVEATLLRVPPGHPVRETLDAPELLTARRKTGPAAPFAIVQVVPTGVRCELGGFAGDACPATNLLAAAAGVVVTHPNAVNASDLNELAEGVLYVEGKTLDDFLLGHVGLRRVPGNRVGTFVDPTGLPFLEDVVMVIDAARAAGGIDCGVYTVLEEEPGVTIEWSERGCAAGTIRNPETLLHGVETLRSRGVDAVGGVSVIHGVTREMFARHLRGEIPNPSGGVEAIVTHLISRIFRIPAAHAPLPYYRGLKERDPRNPRAAAEFISTPHYFSVLKGLGRAPRIVALEGLTLAPAGVLTVDHVAAVVAPASCLGGVPALAAEHSGIPLIAVRENRTILDVTNAAMRMPNVIEVESYLEAAGVVLALREGIALEALRRPLHSARRITAARLAAAARAPESELR